MTGKFKFLEHTADVKFLALGKSLEKVFENSALALKEVICKKKIKISEERTINAKGKDYESLMYNFLEEIIYLLDAEDFLIEKVGKIKISGFKIKAEILGGKASRYKFSNKAKAVTYNEMFVRKEKGKWIAQVVLDI